MSTELRRILDTLSGIVFYPMDNYKARVKDCLDSLQGESTQTIENIRKFWNDVDNLPINDLREYFTRTFDINPLCSLEVGWQLFGENYDRGNFLVVMRREMRCMGLAESSELPDHLTHVLQTLGRMEPEAASEFASACVIPALMKMLAGLEGKGNLFEPALQAISNIVMDHFGNSKGVAN
ncbi:MAG: hypothetical protein A2W25_13205 [candidate division Zixibacteria bacterium RBG_16_53_22]|nr:MAG: hypothetical protein A2W25_13205 [candidate division Zixibacteria bacterium RBG_16_53_22]